MESILKSFYFLSNWLYNAQIFLTFKEKIMAGYIELTEQNFEETIKDGVVMVDFWAPWCGPCRMIAPVIDKLAADYAGKAKICKVNTDEQQTLASKFGIRSIPTIYFYKNGEKVDEMIGAASEQAFKDKIDGLL